MDLEITNKLLVSRKYLQELEKLETLERERIFCRHNMEHFLDVARITLIMCNENGISVDPDIVYSSALLHDIGRTEEYLKDVPHEEAGVRKAEAILDEVNCGEEKKLEILKIIGNHRNGCEKSDLLIEDIFRKADKKSRMCFCCAAQEQCNWNNEKRNMKIEV